MSPTPLRKCTGAGCVASHLCWRVQAPPDETQLYLDRPPGSDGSCPEYWPTVEAVSSVIKASVDASGVSHQRKRRGRWP